MKTWPEPAPVPEQLPRTMKHCGTCRKETPHQIRIGSGVTALICIVCLQRALAYELDRDY